MFRFCTKSESRNRRTDTVLSYARLLWTKVFFRAFPRLNYAADPPTWLTVSLEATLSVRKAGITATFKSQIIEQCAVSFKWPLPLKGPVKNFLPFRGGCQLTFKGVCSLFSAEGILDCLVHGTITCDFTVTKTWLLSCVFFAFPISSIPSLSNLELWVLYPDHPPHYWTILRKSQHFIESLIG